MDARLLQLADSAFPAGAFAHSCGFEALKQLGLLPDEPALVLRLEELTWTTAFGALPFLNEAHQGAADAADRDQDTFLTSHVANRASRVMGRSFLIAAEAMLPSDVPARLRDDLPFCHATVAMGASLAAAAFELRDVRQLFLFGTVRNALSALVRLGAVGPLRAQHLLYGLHPVMTAALEQSQGIRSDDAYTVAPLLEAPQAAQDRLYSRLFQS